MFNECGNLKECIGYDYDFEEAVKAYDDGPPFQIAYYIDNDNKLYSYIIHKEYDEKGNRTFRKQLEYLKKSGKFNFKKLINPLRIEKERNVQQQQKPQITDSGYWI